MSINRILNSLVLQVMEKYHHKSVVCYNALLVALAVFNRVALSFEKYFLSYSLLTIAQIHL